MGLYFIPMIITIVSTMILIYYFGGDTIGEVLICPFFNVFAYIPITNIAMATLTKKDLLEAIEDMPEDMPIKVEVHSQGFAYAYTPIIGCEIIDGWLVFKGM